MKKNLGKKIWSLYQKLNSSVVGRCLSLFLELVLSVIGVNNEKMSLNGNVITAANSETTDLILLNISEPKRKKIELSAINQQI